MASALTIANENLTPDQFSLRTLYNGRAPGYREGSGKVGWIGPERLILQLQPHMAAILRHPEVRVLDLGAGTGEIGERLKAINPRTHVTAVDLSEAMLALALQDSFVDDARAQSVTELTWCPDASRDIVTACGVFDHLSHDDIPLLARDIVRVTRPGGVFGFTFEAADTQHPGPKSNTRFDVDTLAGQFRAAGGHVIEVATLFPAWKLGASQRPVENKILVGCVPQLS